MTDQEKKYLSDIIQAIELIESFVLETKSFLDFRSDIKTQSAVERQIGIIGEAVSKLEKLSPNIKLTNAGKIIAMRNRIIHAYDNIDSSITWAIVKNHLQPLKEEINSFLNSK